MKSIDHLKIGKKERNYLIIFWRETFFPYVKVWDTGSGESSGGGRLVFHHWFVGWWMRVKISQLIYLTGFIITYVGGKDIKMVAYCYYSTYYWIDFLLKYHKRNFTVILDWSYFNYFTIFGITRSLKNL